MTDHTLTPAQEERVRQLAGIIAAEMIGRILLGASERIQEAVAGSIVLLPVVHAKRDTDTGAQHHG
jgi:hypothetical protein